MTQNHDVPGIVSALETVLSNLARPVALHEPAFSDREWDYVKDCLDTGWVSSAGKYVEQFERNLAQYTGVNHAIAVVNGTSALHLCLSLAGVEPGDEVLLPALTFVASANAVSYCNAHPHFVDSEFNSLGIDPIKLDHYLARITQLNCNRCYNKQTKRPIRAVIAMHTFGHPVDLDTLLAVCQKYKLELVEDAAEALGSYYKNQHVGNWGRLSALSFNGNKIITAGGGGAVLTNDYNLAKQAKHLSTTAKVTHPWSFVHDQVGYNYRLPNINAALGCAQLERIGDFISKKRALAEIYHQAFMNIQGVEFFIEPAYARSNYWLNTLILHEGPSVRDQILQKTKTQGISTRPPWVLMNKLPMYKDCPRMDLEIAESLERRIVNIPSSACLGG